MQAYVKKKYTLIESCPSDKETLTQKWDGFGHHIAYFLHNSIDVVLLTIFTNVREVSVYSIYLMIVVGIRNITTTFSSGIEAAFGNMIAKGEDKTLEDTFNIFETFMFMIITILFTCTAVLILLFINVYTENVTDANYYRPLFAYILIAAEAAYCIRLPYHSVVIAAGHFKETRNGAFFEAALNIILSLILVNFFGLVGVAIGTLVSMSLRTIQYVLYLSQNVLKRSSLVFVKKLGINSIACIIIILISKIIFSGNIISYSGWFFYAFKVGIVAICITFGINFIVYKKECYKLITIIKATLISIYRRIRL